MGYSDQATGWNSENGGGWNGYREHWEWEFEAVSPEQKKNYKEK